MDGYIKNMNEIYILFIILGTLFIIENKSINLLAYYVGMVIIIAIIIGIYPNINKIEQYWNGISYISYILVLVQISALTILFGFIIMLYPKNNTEILIKDKIISDKNIKKKRNLINLYKYIILILFIVMLWISYNKYKDMGIGIYEIIKNIIIENKIENIEQKIENIEGVNNTLVFLNKISYLLYTEPSNILKFMILTIILLFAIICLFFILFPTI